MAKNWMFDSERHRLRTGWRILIGYVALMLVIAAVVVPVDALEVPWLESFLWQLAAAPLLVGLAWGLARFVDRRPFREYGLVRPESGRRFAAGIALGGGLVAALFAAALVGGQVTIEGGPGTQYAIPWFASLLGFLARYASVALFEELFHRGFLIVNLSEGLRQFAGARAKETAWIGSSVAFGFLHLTNEHASPLAALNIALLGLLFGLPFVRSGTLFMSIGLHFAWNFALGNVFGLPVSGYASRTSLLLTSTRESLWTGGEFGPEGGLLATVVLVLGIWIAGRWVVRPAA
jgi:membrane protease YdiL (CAAX protease family)